MRKPPWTKGPTTTNAPVDGKKGRLATITSRMHYGTNTVARKNTRRNLFKKERVIPSDKCPGKEYHGNPERIYD